MNVRQDSVRRMKRWTLTSLLTLATVCLCSSAFAQQQSKSFQVENFEPVAAQGLNTLNVNHSAVLPHLTASAGLLFHFADDPLQLVPAGGDIDSPGAVRLIDSQYKGEVLASIGLFDLLEVGLAVPVLFQEGEASTRFGLNDGLSGLGIADIRVTPKIQIIDPKADWAHGFGLGVQVPVYIPTGDDEAFQSDGTVRVEPRLSLDWQHDSGFIIGANVGYQLLRSEEVASNYANGDMLRFALASQVPLGTEKIKAIGSIFGSVNFEEAQPINGVADLDELDKGLPIEGLLGLQFQLPASLVAQVGAGGGLTDGIGAPDFRIFAGLSFTPMAEANPDIDGDGILNELDKCPTEPEDKDGFEDEDGCPDPDNDGDGILDVEDKCPLQPEDPDGFKDGDGCPDPDNDVDGILDADDKCPNEPEDKDGFEDEDGCPDPDNDKDGILDVNDKCPMEPEDKDGFEDADGCPDPDNDGDGVLDGVDKCPLQPGPASEQGCPIKDRDKDGIRDSKDKCPDKPETYNGVKDDDGCPDGKATVIITEESVQINEKVFFATGKADIKRRSFSLLNTLAATLKRYPQITKIRVEGHTDDVGSDASNLDLSKRRAKSVREYLIGKGVKPKRLSSEGYGESRPLCKDVPKLLKNKRKNRRKIKECRATNRRVAMEVMEVNGRAVNAGDNGRVKIQTKKKKIVE